MELNQFYNMDCMEGMKQYPDKFFDLAIVDPPYGGAGYDWSGDVRGRFGGNFKKYDIKTSPHNLRGGGQHLGDEESQPFRRSL